MIGLVRAELLKIRRRQATYVLFVIELILTAIVFLAGGRFWTISGIVSFPEAYATFFFQTIYQLGSLIAIVFAAAYVGADWNWGVLRTIVARGEGRERYLMAKFIALAITLAIALLIMFAAGFVLTFLQSLVYGIPMASPLRANGLQDLVAWLVVGFPVLLQRAAIGFAVAAIFRSQLAGAVVGIVLFLVESVLTTILTILSATSGLGNGLGNGLDSGIQPVGPEWFQFLPVTIGGDVLGALPGGGGLNSTDLSSIFLKPVPFYIALGCVFLYLVVALAIALIALRRQEIS